MLKPSRDRVNQLARTIVEEMDRDASVRLLKEREAVRQSIVHALAEELKHDEERQAQVLQKMTALTDLPAVGSREWELAFRRMLDEEYEKTSFEML